MSRAKADGGPIEGQRQLARTAAGSELEAILHDRQEAVLEALLENPALREPHLLALLARRDLPAGIISAISRRAAWMRSYALKVAMLKHPLTPRHISLPLLKQVYLFDLLSIALTPGTAADLKRLAEDAILSQRAGIALGQQLTLARRGSHRIAAGLLLGAVRQVVEAALENPAMTDQGLAQALSSGEASPVLTEVVLEKPRWRERRPVLQALLRSKHLSLGRFAALLNELTTLELAELQQDPRLPRNLRDYVARFAASRRRPSGAAGQSRDKQQQ